MIALLVAILASQEEAVRKAQAYLDSELPKVPDIHGTPWKESLWALGGLALATEPKYDARVQQARKMLAVYLERVGGKDVYQSTWPVSFAGWLLAELAARRKGDEAAARRVIAILESSQQKDGGWGHSSAQTGYLSGYPRTLVVTTNASLTALGLLRRQGLRVDAKAIDRALGHYEKGQIRGREGAPDELGGKKTFLKIDGGFPYDVTQNAGAEPGRTSGAWWAMWTAGAQETESARRAGSFLRETLGDLPEGHASSALHVFTGAVACRLLGSKEFDRLFRDRILKAQQKDGSFKCICSGDTFVCSEPRFDAMDTPVERIYITALYALALQADRLQALKPGKMEGAQTPTKK